MRGDMPGKEPEDFPSDAMRLRAVAFQAGMRAVTALCCVWWFPPVCGEPAGPSQVPGADI